MRRVPTGGLAATVLAVGALGCGPGDAAREALETTFDTIGRAVHVRHSGPAPQWTPTAMLTIGEVGGPDEAPTPAEFGRVVRVVADGAGRIYVADQIALEIRVFGPAGAHLRTLGRKGAGPGELAGLHGMAWLAPDTLLVVDPGNARLARITARGEPLGHWAWARLTGRSDQFLFNGGPREAYAYVLAPDRPREGETSVWVRYTLGATPDTLAIPDPEDLGVDLPTNLEVCRTERGIGALRNPYAPSLIRMPAPGLERVLAVSSEYRIAFIDASGDTVRVISRDVSRIPLPDSVSADFETERDEFRARWSGADCEGEIAQADVLPVVRDIFFDHHGRMLVEHNRPGGPAFDIYDREGAWLGTVPAPERDRAVPPYLYADRLYTVARDSLDVQRVRVHRLAGVDGA